MPKMILLLLICLLLSGCWDNEPAGGKFEPAEITLAEVPGQELMELTDDRLVFIDSHGVEWVAPIGTWTDGASVPRLALSITDGRFDKAFLKAAVVHDAYCQGFNVDRCPEQYQRKPWREVHRMFYEACLAGNTSKLKAKLMFVAIWLGGPRWDDPDSDLRIVPDEVLRAGYVGCKSWIEKNDPSLEEIESWMGKREPTIIAISNLEQTGMSALNAGDLATSDVALKKSEERLKKALAESPDDLMLLHLKGFHHKNLAMKYRKLEKEDKVNEEIDEAEKTFQDIIEIEPKDPNALTELGNVAILRNDPDQAEVYVRKALSVEPLHPDAKLNLKRIEALRTAQPDE